MLYLSEYCIYECLFYGKINDNIIIIKDCNNKNYLLYFIKNIFFLNNNRNT